MNAVFRPRHGRAHSTHPLAAHSTHSLDAHSTHSLDALTRRKGIERLPIGLTTGVIPSLVPPAVTRRAFGALNAVVRPLLSVGLGNPPAVGFGAAVVETTGRVSGKPRQVPLVAFRSLDRVYVSTVRADSQWLANLEADHGAKVQLAGEFRPGQATVRRGPLNVAVLDLDPA